MQVDKLIDAAEILGELSDNFQRMPEEQRNSLCASLQIEIVRLFLLELAKHIADGMDPYDAMIKTAIGDTPIPAA